MIWFRKQQRGKPTDGDGISIQRLTAGRNLPSRRLDSGTGELAGIAGAMSIVIKGSEHSYEFTYAFR